MKSFACIFVLPNSILVIYPKSVQQHQLTDPIFLIMMLVVLMLVRL